MMSVDPQVQGQRLRLVQHHHHIQATYKSPLAAWGALLVVPKEPWVQVGRSWCHWWQWTLPLAVGPQGRSLTHVA